MVNKHIERLTAILGPGGVKIGAGVAAYDHGFDQTNLLAGLAALPRDTTQIAELLTYCNAVGLSVVPQGGRTGLSGAASSSDGQLILMMQAMSRIVAPRNKLRISGVEDAPDRPFRPLYKFLKCEVHKPVPP